MPSGFVVKLGGALQVLPESDGTPTGNKPAEFGLGKRAAHHGWGEKGTQAANTTAGATSLDRDDWIHHSVSVGENAPGKGNKLPIMPAAASRAGRINIPAAASHYSGNAPVTSAYFGIEKPIVDPVGVPSSAVAPISVFGDVVPSPSKQYPRDAKKGGCGCDGR